MENNESPSVKKVTVDTARTSTDVNPVVSREAVATEKNFKIKKTVYYVLGILEVLFAFRLIFKLLGANPDSGFVSVIYSISGILLAPFTAIFRTVVSKGIETKSVLEMSTIIGMLVYGLIGFAIVKFSEIYNTPKDKIIK